MKATITIAIEVDNIDDLSQVERAFSQFKDGLETGSETTPKPSTAAAAPPADDAAKKAKKAADAKARRAAKKAEKDAAAAAEAAASTGDDLLEDDDAVDLETLKTAVRAFIEVNSIDAVKTIFEKFGAAKISDIDPAIYADVLAELEA